MVQHSLPKPCLPGLMDVFPGAQPDPQLQAHPTWWQPALQLQHVGRDSVCSSAPETERVNAGSCWKPFFVPSHTWVSHIDSHCACGSGSPSSDLRTPDGSFLLLHQGTPSPAPPLPKDGH